MITRRIAAVTTAAVVVAAGGAAAIAATVKDDRKAAESAILADAAKRLDVAPSELKDALGKAQDAQLDQAVKDGKLTQAQADAIKKRRAAEGTVLGLGPHGGPGGPGGPGRGFGHRGGPGGPGGLFGVADDAAKALGLTRAKLFEQLRSGKTLAQIAKAQDKDLADVKATVKAAVSKRLAAAVKDGKLTDAQRDHILGEFDEHFDAFASGKGRMGRGPGPGGPGGPGFGPGGHGPGDGPTGQSGPSGTQDGVYPGETSSSSGQPA